VGKCEIPVEPGFQSINPVDKKIRLERMAAPGGRDIPEREIGVLDMGYTLNTPEDIREFLKGKGIAGVVAERSPGFNR